MSTENNAKIEQLVRDFSVKAADIGIADGSSASDSIMEDVQRLATELAEKAFEVGVQEERERFAIEALTGRVASCAYAQKYAEEKLMKDVVEGTIMGDIPSQSAEPSCVYAESEDLDVTKYHIGDRVKMLIIKEADA